jgi:hypothetical protein
MEKEQEMRLTSLLSNVIIKEVSQKLANQLLAKFKEQTKDDEQTIMTMINKFDQYKEGLDVSKRDITRYDYKDLKSLIIGKEMEKASGTAYTKLKKKWDRFREELPDEETGPYRYENSVLKSLVNKFYDIYPYLPAAQRDIMKYDYLSLSDFIRQNYGKILNKAISTSLSKDENVNPETLLFYIQSYIQNRDRVPRGTKPVALMTFHELEQLVDGTLSQGDEDAEKYQEEFGDIDKVYEQNNLIVFAPKSKDQCVKLKNGRTWCTSREGGGNLYYNYRLGNERTLYYVIDQDKPFKDLNYAVVILVDPYGRMALADGSNSGRYSGHQNIPWSEIEEKIPKLKGLESLFEPKPLTQEEKDLINIVRHANVGDNPMESLGDEKTVEMWMEYNSPRLSDQQFANITPDLQKKYIALGFNLTGGQLQNASEPVLSYYVNKKKDKLRDTSFENLTAEDLDLLSLPMMRKIKEDNKERYAQSLVNTDKGNKQIRIKYPNDAVSKYIKLYGLDEFIQNLPDDIIVFEIDNTTQTNLNLTLPQSFKRFKDLDVFVGINAFNEFPEILKDMKKLIFISLKDSPNITEVPEWVADLPNLMAVTLYGNGSDIKVGPKVQQKWDDGDLNILYEE